MTADGVDMLLLWNTHYYLKNCLLLFGEGICSSGYGSMYEYQQVLMRKVILDKIGTAEEIDVLAALLLASAAQSGQMVLNITRVEPAYVTTYSDMWKFSVGNYYAGAGCMSDAMEKVIEQGSPLVWESLLPHLAAECQLAEDYVQRVIN